MVMGVRQVNEIKYLGIDIEDGIKPFKKYTDNKIEKSEKYKYWIGQILRKKTYKALIGKSFWKGSILPSILHGAQVIYWNKTQIDKFNKIQNATMKHILNMPLHTANAYVRQEVGFSTHIFRDIKMKLGFMQHIIKNNEKLKNLVEVEWERKETGNWIKICKDYMTKIDVTWEKMEDMSADGLRKEISKMARIELESEMDGKSSLLYYRDRMREGKYKRRLWKNDRHDTVVRLFQSGTVLTKSKTGKSELEKNCSTCNTKDTIEHRVGHCKEYEIIRDRYKLKEKRVSEILFEEEDYLVEIYERMKK
jgi:hypothetical protein